ncbi:hypothetical protein HJC23_008054 [Cyclotella cryptica]|uniref:Uncharacterized protein n=1 Tax=Cyclotella cryptica TaxID=29204 RepID=A0ABD3NL23_9STRA|eukprot:CCRYP_020569-RA/>CCRYP_020569-RA protein AED:0.04 eAED:0.04 QI:0/0/0/1/1/1/2/0/440
MLEKYSLLEKDLVTSQDVACARACCLGVMPIAEGLDEAFFQVSGGLPSILVSLLSEAFQSWQKFYHLIPGAGSIVAEVGNEVSIICNERQFELESATENAQVAFSKSMEVKTLQGFRDWTRHLARKSVEQVARQYYLDLSNNLKPAHSVLNRADPERDFDALMDLQDAACEIYLPGIRGAMAFTDEELISRLPLIYNLRPALPVTEIDDARTILIHQVTKRQTAQADVGFLIWPSAIVLGRWLLSNEHILRGKTVLEIGAGCGLVGILAAAIVKDGSSPEQVIVTDVNNTVLENIFRNINLNDLSSVATVAKLDFYQQSGDNYAGKWIAGEFNGENERHCAPVDIVLGADIICQPEDATAAAKTIYDALVPGGVAYVTCANEKHRFGVGIFSCECEKLDLKVKQSNVREMYDGNLLSEGMNSAAGFVDDMNLTFFEVAKY